MSEQTELSWEWHKEKTSGPEGWFATVLCWDPEEGCIPLAGYWNGETWGNCPVVAYAGPFATVEEAEKWAEDNDPGW